MWSLYDKENCFLEPLKFSNGKTQEDVVKEVLKAVKEGFKIIFIRGVCGTGKSAIALNIAKNLGKTSIIVPSKNLQNQYKKDYEGNKYLLKNNNEKLNISVITGRNNHKCLFLENNKAIKPTIIREINSKLSDIFKFENGENEKSNINNKSADNSSIPCKIEIKEKNFLKIKDYLKQNKKISLKNIPKLSDVRRIPLASVCPYWSPVLLKKYDLREIDYGEKKTYEGLNGTVFNIYKRKPGCKFYEQFDSYIDADVIVFNSLKYKLESALNRKPKTEAEIIDECDEFLDSFYSQRNINIDILQNSLIQIIGANKAVDKIIRDISEIIKKIKTDDIITKAVNSNQIIQINETPIYSLFRLFLDSPKFLEEIEDESYLFDVEETIKMFEDFLDETYLSFNNKDNNLIVGIVTTNLSKKFKEMVDKNKIIILMSGTLHSEIVLKNIFGLENFKIINAETMHPGKIDVLRTGMEFDCKYENFLKESSKKELFFKTLDKCLRVAKKPVLVHVNSFKDMPSEKDISDFELKNLISREEFEEMQKNDKDGKITESFKKGERDVLFTTKCSRGMDFPGEQCNSIIFTKYPNPNIKEPFWKILYETKKEQYWELYKDKAIRELLQRVYRGLRSKDDHVYVLSPDKRVLDFFERKQ